MFYNKEKGASMLKSSHSRGNVLFLILIAVALFGALTAAITKSDRSSTSMDRERGTINASDFMAYAGAMEKSVARMLGDEISEGGISFENDIWQSNDDQPVEVAAMFPTCTTAKCRMFDANGGGMTPKTFIGGTNIDAPATADIKPGHAGVYTIAVKGVGSAALDMVLLVAGIEQNTCKEINRQLGITNPSGIPPEDSWSTATLYAGSFPAASGGTDEIGDSASEVENKSAACVHRAGSGGRDDNFFYQVLLPR